MTRLNLFLIIITYTYYIYYVIEILYIIYLSVDVFPREKPVSKEFYRTVINTADKNKQKFRYRRIV